jgi:hypothetical protein
MCTWLGAAVVVSDFVHGLFRTAASIEKVQQRQQDAIRSQMAKTGMRPSAMDAVFAGARSQVEKSGHKWYACCWVHRMYVCMFVCVCVCVCGWGVGR